MAGDLNQRMLSRAVKEGKVAGAYLFTASGSKAASQLARQFAGMLFCKEGRGCGVCDGCRKFLSGNHVDLLELGKEGNAIKMEDVRQIPDFISKRAYEGGYQCILIEHAHLMQPRVQNYLLKPLEEPGDKVVFLLSTCQGEKLLPTILSRCMHVEEGKLPQKEVLRALGAKDARTQAAAAWGQGSVAQAQAFLEDEDWQKMREAAAQIAGRLASSRNPSAFEISQSLLVFDARLDEALFSLALFFRDAERVKMTKNTTFLMNPDMLEQISLASRHFTSVALRTIIDIVMRAYENKQRCPNCNNKLLIEGMLFEILEVKAKCRKQ